MVGECSSSVTDSNLLVHNMLTLINFGSKIELYVSKLIKEHRKIVLLATSDNLFGHS